jgi:hypothetical protein
MSSTIDLEPPPFQSVVKCTETTCYTKSYEYALHNSSMWWKNRGCAFEPWKLMPSADDGPIDSISVDSSNFTWTSCKNEEGRRVHFRKVTNDNPFTGREKHAKNNIRPFFKLPYLSRLWNYVFGKHYLISNEPYAVSFRGRECSTYTDPAGTIHNFTLSCSQVSQFSSCRRWINQHDPYTPPRAQIRISLPQTVDSGFQGEAISESASMHLVLGYMHEETTKRLQLLTRLSDLDINGITPWLTYRYKKTEGAYVIPEAKWDEHALPEGARISRFIKITQIGKGNAGKIIEIPGSNQEGKEGIFTKDLSDSSNPWAFHEAEVDIAEKDYLANEIHNCEPFYPTVFNWGAIVNGGTARIKDFARSSLSARVSIHIGEKNYKFSLIRRVNIFIASIFKTDNWLARYDLVPAEDVPEYRLQAGIPLRVKIFEHKTARSVKLSPVSWFSHLPTIIFNQTAY